VSVYVDDMYLSPIGQFGRMKMSHLMADTTEELLANLLATAQEHLRWQRAFALPEVRKTIERTLTTSQLRRAYEMCDGTKQSTEIATDVGTSKASMSGWTRRWRDLGIAYETAREALAGAMAKTGARRQAELVKQVALNGALLVSERDGGWRVLAAVYDLTPRQARLAVAVAAGATRRDDARQTGVSERVAKTDLATVFEQCGVDTVAALARIVAELDALSGLASATDVLFKTLLKVRRLPALRIVPPYYDHPAYLDAMCSVIKGELARLDRPLVLRELAERESMSVRTFTRRFREEVARER